MKILLYCYAFYPSIGGIESTTKTLADSMTDLGHTCTVVTETESQDPDNFRYQISRKPSRKEILALIRQHDVICNIELSMKFFILSKIARKPLIWLHNGYKLLCIDAFGWYEDGPAPMSPWASIRFYRKHKGLKFALDEGIKLYARRWASNFIFKNVAVSEWVAKRQPLRNQIQIYAPFPVANFLSVNGRLNKEYDFLFFGRLVAEKGVDVLLRAFHHLLEKTDDKSLKLAIIGYGKAKEGLEKLSRELGITENVFFLGPKRGQELADEIAKTEVTIAPSTWEEPFGGVTLEAIAAGRVPISSRNGGMKEIVGEEGLTFTNGNWMELYERMNEIVYNQELREKQRSKRKEQMSKFDPKNITSEFLLLFHSALK
jgi:glycosyltransferase involved in cell wall biosynthesis